MVKSCIYAPKKGASTFYKLKKEFGYDLAWDIYGIGISSKFKNDFKNTLSLDAEGIPTYDSLVNNPAIQKLLGYKHTKNILEKNFAEVDNTINNYNMLLDQAITFNKSNPNNKKFTAIVETTSNDTLKISLYPNTKSNKEKSINQYSTNFLNQKIVNILSPLNITIGMLNDVEVNAGRVGLTSFDIAKNIATDTISMIKIANNMEGVQALSEEFSHVVIGALRKDPIIQRSINALSNNEELLKEILQDSYEDTYEYYDGNTELIAEEALGHILQKNLARATSSQLGGTTLLDRAYNYIKNKFKDINKDEVENALVEAETVMSNLANDILSGNLKLTKEDIINSQREVNFNALSDRIDRNINMLKNAIKVEAKRYKISKGDDKDSIKDSISRLEYSLEQEDTTLGVLQYAKEALSALNMELTSLKSLDIVDVQDKFKLLRSVRTTLQSYSGFINELNKAFLDEMNEDSNDFERKIVINTPYGEEEIDVASTIKELNHVSELLASQYFKIAVPAFAKFLEPILGERISTSMNDNTTISVQELLETAQSDISFLDRWVDSMSNSSDVLLQSFNKVYQEALEKSRSKSIKQIKAIQALRQEAESYGITSYEWMFEKYNDGTLTGNYISEVNEAQYERDVKEFMEYLDNKYGKNPRKKDLIDAKLAEKKEWFDTHADKSVFGEYAPKVSVYKNKDFEALTDKQLLIRKKFLALKKSQDSIYPTDKTYTTKAIQMRKDGVQRFIDSSKSPETIWTNIKENLASEFLERSDDDSLFGDTTKKGLTDFAGKEYMVLPALFTNKLENPNELSTDIFSTLMAYTSATNNYEAMDEIVDPLEVGRTIVTEYRKFKKTRGDNKLVEKFKALGITVVNDILESEGSNIEKKLDDFFESQIYHRYLKDSGTFDVFGKKVNKNKLTSWVLRVSSTAQLGFNFLSNIANVTTGVAMQNIEAASREFFSAKDLFNADKEYMSLIMPYLSELGSRNKSSKLALFDELFNVRQNFNKEVNNNQRKSILARLFNSEIAFLGQEGGDHWLYNRTAIAMAKRHKVIVPGKGEMSLWDALQIKDSFKGNTTIKEMYLPEGTTNLDGTEFNIGEFSRKIAVVNHGLFGIYNDEDKASAHRVIMGRLIMQYRNWMKPQFNKRFQKAQYNLELDSWQEGYYRTLLRVSNGLLRGKYQLASIGNQLNEHEKANVLRAITEIAQFAAIWALANLIEWPDDKKRPWALKLAEYSSKRMVQELGNLTPSPLMLESLLKTVKTPVASISTIGNTLNLFNSIIDPRDWVNEIQSGPYEGLSTLEKNFIKAPIPGVAQWRQIDRFIEDLDTGIGYYMRPATY